MTDHDSSVLSAEPGVPAATSVTLESAVAVVREVALFCLKAGRTRADSVVLDHKVMGFADWAESEMRALVPQPEPVPDRTGPRKDDHHH